jgi:UDP:flavonoid glycosyltransferase YjiC (YdhE family)
MKCVLAGFGSQGDNRPLVALGAALRARGHEVVFPADRIFAPLIERMRAEGGADEAVAAIERQLSCRRNRPDLPHPPVSPGGSPVLCRAT